VTVLDAGRIAESGPTAGVFAAPSHPATRALLSMDPNPTTGRAGSRTR
jgi:peptide/nickel transport system ATP-binding protein